ncbi:NAD(P)/FAD-dependent oxidoreductase [Massilia sp.]|uniref:NAD(P)/FAD-dependent oxidoreductase n=1 Tax=Massilia sp. TaxID=1882437 RepID=UPI00352DBE34
MQHVRSTPADDRGCGWFHLSPPRQARPAHAGSKDAPWVVIGAGLTGLSAARRLAQHFPSDEIVLVEAQEVGFGASGRNSGFAIDLPHDIGAADYIGDPATARMNLKLNLAAQDIIRKLVVEHDIACDLRPVGKYQGAAEPRGIAVLDAYRRGLDKLGQDYQVLDEDAMRAHLGTGFYSKGLFTPGTMLLQPAALVKGLADSLPSNVTLYENTPITGFDYANDKTILTHQGGRITAGRLLLTNNAFASSFGFLKGKLLPVFTYASMSRPLTAEEQARLGGRDFWGLIPADPFGSTLRRTSDNRLLVRNSFSFNPNGRSSSFVRGVGAYHRASFARRFPMLPGVEFDFTWGGAMCLSRNHAAHFGQLRPGVYGALCCNGLGITRGTITGALLADWLAGERNELIDFLMSAPGPCANPPQPLLSLGVNLNLRWGQRRAGKES